MSNGTGIETPANKIATAGAVLTLAFRLNSEVIAKKITRDIFDKEVLIYTGNTGVKVPAYSEGTEEDLQSGIFNIVLIALSASALTLDETLDECFGALVNESDLNRKNIRILVNQLRNAFAHNPWRPKWVVFPKYRNAFPIVLDDGTSFTFDATQLDGQNIAPSQIGGLEFWVKLLQHCNRAVS